MTNLLQATAEFIRETGGAGRPDRELVNTWVRISGFSPYIAALQKKDIPVPPGADTAIGFVYIDHDSGISLKVEVLCTGTAEGAQAPFPLASYASLRFRYSSLKGLDLARLPGEDARKLGLPEVPDWVKHYETPKLKVIRGFTWLDGFRARGFFDDVMAVLPRKERDLPELVWVRLERYLTAAGRFTATLLNEPFHACGRHRNDCVEVEPVVDPGGVSLIVGPVSADTSHGTEDSGNLG